MNNELFEETKNNKISARVLAVTGITAAAYFAATLAIAPLGFGPIQLRFSEIMVLLAFIDPLYAPGLVIGCFLSNMFSPAGIIDMFFGTMGTIMAVTGIIKSKNLITATIWPTLSMVIVSIGISLGYALPYFPTLITTMLGEFAVVTCVGYPVFKSIMNNANVIDILKINK